MSEEWQTSLLRPNPQTLAVSGGIALSGELEMFGSKKSMPKILAASLLTDEACSLEGIAWIQDVAIASCLLVAAGRAVEKSGPRALHVTGYCSMPAVPQASFGPVAEMSRVPILTAGPQLARFGEAWIPPLGGDRIGVRRIEMHIWALRQLGAQVTTRDHWLHATTVGLRGACLVLPFPMVGVTEHVLLTAALAAGRTELRNAAIDPEIEELGTVLRAMGAKIEIDSNRRAISVVGVEDLGGFSHTVGRDRIEAGSWASLALASGGDIFIRGVTALDMAAFLTVYRATGAEAKPLSDGIRFRGPTGKHPSIRVESGPYPLFETDWHPPMLAALTQTEGDSSIHETLFENRFSAVADLRAMGADIEMVPTCAPGQVCRFGRARRPHVAVVRGPTRLRKAETSVPDLRGGFALLVAALTCPDESTLEGSEMLERGYEDLPSQLERLGGTIRVVE